MLVNTVYKITMIRILILTSSLFLSAIVHAQDFKTYVEMSWANNAHLQSIHFDLAKAEAALQEARASYLPTVAFGTQYTLASGGRSIDFPIGDLLNPVYSSLNELTGTQGFQTVDNEKVLFLPNNFYDARFRIQQPVYYPELDVNKSLKVKQIDYSKLEILAYKRLLVRDLMQAYFQWQQSLQIVRIYEEADALLLEAARSTKSMIRNGVALPSALSRIEAEEASVKANSIEATANRKNAWNYLSFILGEGEILPSDLSIDLPELPTLNANIAGAREELDQLSLGIEMQRLAVEKEDLFHKPKLSVLLDLGSQDFNFGLAPYALFGLNLEWNIFDFKRSSSRRKQAEAGVRSIEEQKLHTERKIDLQETVSNNNLQSAMDQALTFEPRINAADKNYRDVLKKYQAGSANYLELLDARTQVTQSKIAYMLARYNAWNRWAEDLYVRAAYPIN